MFAVIIMASKTNAIRIVNQAKIPCEEAYYDYDENDEHDMLNCLDIYGEFGKNVEEYVAYIQNVEAGVYIIVAKNVRIER